MSASTLSEEMLAKFCSVSGRAERPVCKVSGLAAIRLARPDIETAVRFFEDFGLSKCYSNAHMAMMRGTNDNTPSIIIERGPARYLGMNFTVASADDLQRLAAAHGVGVVEAHPERGGQCVLLRDPDNLMVEVIHGWTPLPALPSGDVVPANRPGHTPRINQTVRLNYKTPPRVCRLGHTVLGVTRFAESLAWYQENLGLIVSDFQMMETDPLPVVAFMRCDRGDTPTDHHTLALASAVEIGHLHSAFELADMDAVVAAGVVLKQRNHHHTWGIGRHILGSQIFDYWRDQEGDMFEHYADGDLFDAQMPTGYHAFNGEALHQWGPRVSADMAGKVPSFHLVQTLISRIRSNDDLSLRRLINLLKAAA
ncbi:MAG: VOC family protein [Hahellaceae bacterium]|nr:VOC family protein [Hahellaceae bacterium]